MSSTGQIVGGIVGAVVGYFAGNPVLGAQIGMTIGGLVDPPKTLGPRLNDLTAQTSIYGAFIPRIYGTAPVVGNIFWIQGNKLVEHKADGGGKGGPTVTNFNYFATFAVGLCEGPISGVQRIWIGGQLWYDAGSSDLATIIASNENAAGFTLYTGSDTQLADPLIQADHGVANVPAYRGLAYIVFNELPLKGYGNSLAAAQVKVEVVMSGTNPVWSLAASTSDVSTADENHRSVTYSDEWAFYEWQIDSAGVYPANSSFTVFRVDLATGEKTPYTSITTPIEYNMGGAGYVGFASLGYGDINHVALCNSTRRGLAILYPGGGVDYSYPLLGSSYYITNYCLVGGILAYSAGVGSFGVNQRLIVHEIGTDLINEYAFPATVDSVMSVAISAGKVFVNTGDTTSYIYVFDLATRAFVVNQTLTSFTGLGGDSGQRLCWSGNPVENYLFFNNGGDLYRVDTLSYAIEHIITDPIVSQSVSPEHRLFRSVTSNVIFVRRLNYVYTGVSRSGVFAKTGATSNTIQLSDVVQSECLKSDLLTAADLDVTDLTDQVRGYRVSSPAPLRGGIDPLRKAWPFDATQHGYKIKFKKRGGASVATITEGELDARAAGASPGVQIANTREMDLVLPKQLTAQYLDATREYDVNVAEESRQ